MKKLLAVLLVMSPLALWGQARDEVHVGLGLPVYTVLGVPLSEDLESIGADMSVGYKCLHPWKKNLEWYIGADLYHRQLSYDQYAYPESGKAFKLKGQAFNIPVEVGLQYAFPLRDRVLVYADAGCGLNLNLGYGLVSPNSFMMQNTTSFVLNSLLNLDFKGSLSTCFSLELGARVDNRFNVGLRYSNFGLVETCRKYEVLKSYYDGEYTATSIEYYSANATIVLSSISLRVGYLF